MGPHMGDGMLYTLFFADEEIGMMGDKDGLNYMIRILQEAYEQGGLINRNKSKCMIFGNNEKRSFLWKT